MIMIKEYNRRFLMFITAFFLGALAVVAQEIPEELINLGVQECKAGCKPSFGEKICQTLCRCAMGEFKNRLKLPEYLALKSATMEQNITPDQRKIMNSIAQTCDKQVEFDVPLPKAGKPVPKPGTKPVPKPGEKKR